MPAFCRQLQEHHFLQLSPPVFLELGKKKSEMADFENIDFYFPICHAHPHKTQCPVSLPYAKLVLYLQSHLDQVDIP